MSKSLEWDNLGFSLLPWIRTGLDVMGFETMTPLDVIREVIPLPRRKLKSEYRKTLTLRYINRLVVENLVKRVAIISVDLNSSNPFLRLER